MGISFFFFSKKISEFFIVSENNILYNLEKKARGKLVQNKVYPRTRLNSLPDLIGIRIGGNGNKIIDIIKEY